METMAGKKTLWAQVNAQGDLVIPRETIEKFGLTPGARVRLEDDTNHVRLHRPVTHLAKVYVEPTVYCNLDCRTCVRNMWAEKLGSMTEATFARILDNVKAIEPRPSIFFGGLGEPFFHSSLIDWIARAKAIGATVELITNGTLLTEEKARAIVASGLDNLWVSIDGATPDSYADVRLGATLPLVIENVMRLRRLRKGGHFAKPEIDVAFVAMKRNIHELPDVLKLAQRLDARQFKMSHVLPYTEELRDEILYAQSLRDPAYMQSLRIPHLSLPRMEFNEVTSEPLLEGAAGAAIPSIWPGTTWAAPMTCAITSKVAPSPSDGMAAWRRACPCCTPMPTTSAPTGIRSSSTSWATSTTHDLLDLWLDPEYVQYRERVHSFAFAPCTFCGGCELLESNEEDCVGNEFPSCGGCLWAQGLIQCP